VGLFEPGSKLRRKEDIEWRSRGKDSVRWTEKTAAASVILQVVET